MFEHTAEHVELARHQVSRVRGQQVSNTFGRGMRPVGGTERVVDVHVRKRGELRRKRRIVGLFARLEAHVLEHGHIAIAKGGDDPVRVLTHDIGRHAHVGPKELPHTHPQRRHAQ